MNRKQHLSILFIALLSVLIGSTILFIKAEERVRRDSARSASNKAAHSVNTPWELDNDDLGMTGSMTADSMIREEIDVINNYSPLDLKAVLAENPQGRVVLELEYKMDGKSVAKTLNADQIPEIRSIFRFREQHKGGYRLEHLTVNKDVFKIYFKVVGKQSSDYTSTTTYSYDLKNSKTKKILYSAGIVSPFFISDGGKYNAVSIADRLDNSNVVIIGCEDDSLLFNGLENDSSSLYAYSYGFIKWKSRSACALKQHILIKDGSEVTVDKTVYYDAEKDMLYE